MKRFATIRFFLYGALLLFALSIVLSVLSFSPIASADRQDSLIIDSSFRLTPQETYRQGLGSFHGDENLSLEISVIGKDPINFTLLTYGGLHYSNLTTEDINYSFPAGADYYEAVFLTNSTAYSRIHFQVYVQKHVVTYPFSWLATPAKVLLISSWVATILLLLSPQTSKPELLGSSAKRPVVPVLSPNNRRLLKAIVLMSLVFWILILTLNSYPLGTFENWYTDSARHPYSANLFMKMGVSIFDTPLGTLSSGDSSFYKFVTWPEMPHLYPLGSVFLFLPFGWLLESGIAQTVVFKMEIALFLLAAHLSLYYFLKRFWKQDMSFVLKAIGIYLLYIVLVVYSADGQFDAVAFLFSMAALTMFLKERYDYSLLLVVVATTFKYQAGIFLLPLAILSLVRFLGHSKLSVLLRNRAIFAAIALGTVDLFTAYLSAPYLLSAKPEFIMNGVNAFNPHAQISWSLQSFSVLLTLAVTLFFAVYSLNKSRVVSLFAIFSLLPCFTMPYFQPWYLPFFFVYPLIPQQKRTLEVTMVWLLFMVIVLSFGGLSYNPVHILDNIRKIFNI
jgi:hypothetical protein